MISCLDCGLIYDISALATGLFFGFGAVGGGKLEMEKFSIVTGPRLLLTGCRLALPQLQSHPAPKCAKAYRAVSCSHVDL